MPTVCANSCLVLFCCLCQAPWWTIDCSSGWVQPQHLNSSPLSLSLSSSFTPFPFPHTLILFCFFLFSPLTLFVSYPPFSCSVFSPTVSKSTVPQVSAFAFFNSSPCSVFFFLFFCLFPSHPSFSASPQFPLSTYLLYLSLLLDACLHESCQLEPQVDWKALIKGSLKLTQCFWMTMPLQHVTGRRSDCPNLCLFLLRNSFNWWLSRYFILPFFLVVCCFPGAQCKKNRRLLFISYSAACQ